MTYRNTADLPESVRAHLPQHAQEIYVAAFNNAWNEYADRHERETLAHKVAWAAVKRAYVKHGDHWLAR